MTDRELLEKAAKAAGYSFNGLWYDAQAGLLVWEPARDIFESRDWNPLTDDGDALRLAVTLRLVVDIGSQGVHAFKEGQGEVEAHGGDPAAATRRAIVRAAAALCGSS